MHLLMYSSDYTGELEDMPRDFRKILMAARTNNPKHDITGILFFDQNKFIQILEGEKEALHNLLEVIRQDPIHMNINLLMDCTIDRRELENWNMKAFDLTGHSNKDWSLLEDFRDAYQTNFKPSSVQIISWLNQFIEHHERFKRLEH